MLRAACVHTGRQRRASSVRDRWDGRGGGRLAIAVPVYETRNPDGISRLVRIPPNATVVVVVRCATTAEKSLLSSGCCYCCCGGAVVVVVVVFVGCCAAVVIIISTDDKILSRDRSDRQTPTAASRACVCARVRIKWAAARRRRPEIEIKIAAVPKVWVSVSSRGRRRRSAFDCLLTFLMVFFTFILKKNGFQICRDRHETASASKGRRESKKFGSALA